MTGEVLPFPRTPAYARIVRLTHDFLGLCRFIGVRYPCAGQRAASASVRLRRTTRAALRLTNRGPAGTDGSQGDGDRSSILSDVEGQRNGRYALPDGLYFSNRYALDAHTFLHLLILTCVSAHIFG